MLNTAIKKIWIECIPKCKQTRINPKAIEYLSNTLQKIHSYCLLLNQGSFVKLARSLPVYNVELYIKRAKTPMYLKPESFKTHKYLDEKLYNLFEELLIDIFLLAAQNQSQRSSSRNIDEISIRQSVKYYLSI